jgi:hypothetical protein
VDDVSLPPRPDFVYQFIRFHTHVPPSRNRASQNVPFYIAADSIGTVASPRHRMSRGILPGMRVRSLRECVNPCFIRSSAFDRT